MNIIQKVLRTNELVNKPPVLLDIGASGGVPKLWNRIAAHSICIGFDADARKTHFENTESSKYLKKLIVNKLIDTDSKDKRFYLTKSPYCSSLLEPDEKKLSAWDFSDLFQVQVIKELKSYTLTQILEEHNITYIDWFKTDSQGIDLRLFKSLDKNITGNVHSAEFEPGIGDAYKGEDKLHHVMDYMQGMGFWLTSLKIFGPIRLSQANLSKYFYTFEKKFCRLTHEKSPFWAEISYSKSNYHDSSLRDLYVGAVFAILKKQYGFALELAVLGTEKYPDSFFPEIRKYAIKKIRVSYLSAFCQLIKNYYTKLFG